MSRLVRRWRTSRNCENGSVVLAIPGPAVADLVRQYSSALSVSLVVDAANKVGGDGPANSYDVIMATAPAARYARAGGSHQRLSLTEQEEAAVTLRFDAAESSREGRTFGDRGVQDWYPRPQGITRSQNR